MKLSIIGTGNVGLVTGACFSAQGHEVRCADIDAEKVDRLQRLEFHSEEPGLTDLVARNVEAGRLSFTTDTPAAVTGSEVVILCVETPQGEDGKPDLERIRAAAQTIAENIKGFTLIVVKSTVPVGTTETLRKLISSCTEEPFTIACNPEFLKAGSAVEDFREPDRVVAGCDDERSFELLRELYRDFTGSGPLLKVDTRTAELIKYASNAMLACRISFMNSLAGLCEQLGADAGELARGVGLDSRIGPGALAASPGYGGSCLPKDIRALIDTLKEHGLDARLFEAIDSVNESQKASHIERLRSFLGDLRDRRIAVLGLSFKAGSADTANSAAVRLIGQLIEEGAEVAAWDPAAMENMRRVFPDIEYSRDPYEASRGASAIVILTEWDSLRELDFQTLGGLVSNKLVLDGRGLFDPEVLLALGFSYSAVGRPPTLLEPGCPENAVDSRDSES